MVKATAVAYAIQGLVKYHGLKDRKRRIPYHDSISVCAEKLTTTATIEFGNSAEDLIEINGRQATPQEASRVSAVVSTVKKLAKIHGHFTLSGVNSLKEGKGLGFSAAAFAAISLASCTALGLKLAPERLSEIARLGAGSASRSVVGGFSIWFANKNGRSYAKRLDGGKEVALAMGVVPIPSSVKTEMAHEESVLSPFFKARLKDVPGTLRAMLKAIRTGDVDGVGRIAEAETLSLHAITMTGKGGLLLMAPETIKIIQRIRSMREEHHIPVWYSLDTGPSVYINTKPEFVNQVCDEIRSVTGLEVIKSGVGGPAHIIQEHLF